MEHTSVLERKGNEFHFNTKLLENIKGHYKNLALRTLENVSPSNLRDSSGSTLLHYSARYGNPELAQYLIEKGCKLDDKNNDGCTPLMEAMGYCKGVYYLTDGDQRGIDRQINFDWFLSKVAEVFDNNTQAMAKFLFESKCPLHHVIRHSNNNTEVTQYYLENGYQVNTEDLENGRTPLHVAVDVDDLAHVKLLVEHGAKVNLVDNNGKKVICNFDYTSEIYSVEQLEIFSILIKHGASLDSLYGHYLFEEGSEAAVCLGLQYVHPLTKYLNGRTVLHLITSNKNIKDMKVFEHLSKRYFNIDAKDNQGNTALHIAMDCKSSEKVEFLLRNGARFSNLRKQLKGVISDWLETQSKSCVKIFELCFEYDRFVHDLFRKKEDMFEYYDGRFGNMADLITARLALIEVRGYKIHEDFRFMLDEYSQVNKLFNDFKLQLEGMKTRVVYESVTMFDLVTATDTELRRYAGNNDLVSKFKFLSHVSRLNYYYYKYVRNRLDRAVDIIKQKHKASFVIFKLTGIQHDLVLYEIISYLKVSDFRSLSFVL